jgi:hypothetical protein
MRPNQKPPKGTAAKARQSRRAAIERAELKAKRLAKERDGYRCRRCGSMGYWLPVEAAHLTSKGMGGDHGTRSALPSDYVTLCWECHQGPLSVHSGDIRILCGPERGDGPVTFRRKRSVAA